MAREGGAGLNIANIQQRLKTTGGLCNVETAN